LGNSATFAIPSAAPMCSSSLHSMTGDGRRAVDRALVQIDYCIDLKSRQQTELAAWLAGSSAAVTRLK
jgi:hypothetical protein